MELFAHYRALCLNSRPCFIDAFDNTLRFSNKAGYRRRHGGPAQLLAKPHPGIGRTPPSAHVKDYAEFGRSIFEQNHIDTSAFASAWKRRYSTDLDDVWGKNPSNTLSSRDTFSRTANSEYHNSSKRFHSSPSPWEEEHATWTAAWTSWWKEASADGSAGFVHGYYFSQSTRSEDTYTSTNNNNDPTYRHGHPLLLEQCPTGENTTAEQVADWEAYRDVALLLHSCQGDILLFAQSLNVECGYRHDENRAAAAKAAYRACLLKYHPDRLGSAPLREQVFGVHVTKALAGPLKPAR